MKPNSIVYSKANNRLYRVMFNFLNLTWLMDSDSNRCIMWNDNDDLIIADVE